MVTSDNDTVFAITILNHGKHEDYDDEIVTVMLTMPFDIYCDSEDLPYDRRRRNIMRNTVFMVNQVSGFFSLFLFLTMMLIADVEFESMNSEASFCRRPGNPRLKIRLR